MDQPRAAKETTEGSGRWRLTIDKKALPPGDYTVLVGAEDLSGNATPTAELAVIEFTVKPRPESVDPSDPEAKNDLVVTVTYAGQPEDKIDVTITGPEERTEATDEDGQALFADLTPGDYEVTASGVARNSAVEAPPKKCKVNPKPRPRTEVTVKLEMKAPP
jgi:hypothetical protein